MSCVWQDGPADKSEILVLIALADFCNDDGECWPSVAGIARKSRMTERGVQKIIGRLCEIGWVTINPNAGRKGCNLYTVSPPNPVHPRTPFTPNAVTQPPNHVPLTPEPRSPEPSITIIKPSVSIKNPDLVLDHLLSVSGVTREAAESFISYRKRSKAKALTDTAAKRLAVGLWEIFDKGGDPSDALGLAEERGWVSVKPDWYFRDKEKPQANGARNGTSSRAQFDIAHREYARRLSAGEIQRGPDPSDPFAI